MAPTTRFRAAADRTCNQPVQLSWVRKAFVLAIFVAMTFAFPLRAQFFDASQAGGPVTITAPWRFHTGDNPQWASPNFDDSQWSLFSMDRSWNVQGYAGYSGYAWYRIRLQLPASRVPLALGITYDLSEEIYADGTLIGLMGKMRPTPGWLTGFQNIEVVLLPPKIYGRTIELAIRAWQSPKMAAFLGGRSWPLPVVGPEQSIRSLHSLSVNQTLVHYMPELFNDLVALVIGLISFGLFFLRLRATEYAWAGLYLFGQALGIGFFFYSEVYNLPMDGSELAGVSMDTGFTICWLFLIWRFIRAKADGFLWASAFAAVCIPFSILLVYIGFATVPQYLFVHGLATLCIGVLIFARLVHEAWRGNQDAQIFLVPFLLNSVMDAASWALAVLNWLGLHRIDSFNSPIGLELFRGPYFAITWDQLSALLSYLAIGAVLVRRFTRSAEQEQRLATEMESARQVQAQLVPLDFPRLSGFHIDAAYLPASEVGGDFYQVFQQSDGSVVIVIGDVCGKGLKAAMTGVLAIGVAHTLASEQLHPGALLARFNRELVGFQNGGFITCICARVARDGAAAFANAGHLPPYRNGEEIEVQSSLPLGITPDVEYVETSIQLAPGDSLTFLSDGVVEARSKAEGFFGFDRMREISKQSARAIADAAQKFGQEDDITVLTLLFSHPERVPA